MQPIFDLISHMIDRESACSTGRVLMSRVKAGCYRCQHEVPSLPPQKIDQQFQDVELTFLILFASHQSAFVTLISSCC